MLSWFIHSSRVAAVLSHVAALGIWLPWGFTAFLPNLTHVKAYLSVLYLSIKLSVAV